MSRLRIHQTRSVKFKNGGTITVTLSRVNLAVLTQDERKFVFGLVDSLETQSRALREGFGLVDSLETQSRALREGGDPVGPERSTRTLKRARNAE